MGGYIAILNGTCSVNKVESGKCEFVVWGVGYIIQISGYQTHNSAKVSMYGYYSRICGSETHNNEKMPMHGYYGGICGSETHKFELHTQHKHFDKFAFAHFPDSKKATLFLR